MIATDDPLRPYLDEGERVLWTGKPVLGPYLRRNWTATCFGVFFLSFTCVWLTFALGIGSVMWGLLRESGGDGGLVVTMPSLLFSLVGSVFLLVGGWLTFGHHIASYLEWRKMRYAITDRRVIILGGAFRRRLDSIPLLRIPTVRIVEHGGGSGDLVLGPYPPVGAVVTSRNRGYQPTSPALFAVPHAREVYGLLRDAAQALAERARREGGPGAVIGW
jgi:hypothetical protein